MLPADVRFRIPDPSPALLRIPPGPPYSTDACFPEFQDASLHEMEMGCERWRNYRFLRGRLKERANNPTIKPSAIASAGNPGTPDVDAAAEVDSAVVVDVVGIVDVVDSDAGPDDVEDVEIELVVCCCVFVVVVCTWVVDHVVDVVVVTA